MNHPTPLAQIAPPKADLYLWHGSSSGYQLQRVAAGTGAVTGLTVATMGFLVPEPLAVTAAGDLFLLEWVGQAGRLIKVPAGASTPYPVPAAVDPDDAYFFDDVRCDGAGTHLYAVDVSQGTVLKIPVNGNPPISIWTPPDPNVVVGAHLAVDRAENVYVLSGYGLTLTTLPANGGTPIVLELAASLPELFPTALAVDPSGTYAFISLWSADLGQSGMPGSSAIARVPLNGDPPTTFGTGLDVPVGLAADHFGCVYICDHYNDRVLMITDSGTGGQFTVCTTPRPRTVTVRAARKPTPSEPDLIGRLFGGAAADGGGWLLIGNTFVPVPPRSPLLSFLVRTAARYRWQSVRNDELAQRVHGLRRPPDRPR